MTKLVFYKANYGNIFDKAISLVDGGPYSHVELVTAENENYWTTFASSNREGKVRMRLMPKSDHWDVVDVGPIRTKDLERYLGADYDWIGLGRTIWDWFPAQDDAWVCSAILAEVFGLENPKTYGVEDLRIWAISKSINKI